MPPIFGRTARPGAEAGRGAPDGGGRATGRHLALCLLWASACQPALSPSLLQAHQPVPQQGLQERVLQSSRHPEPAWLKGAPPGPQLRVMGEGSGPDLDAARAVAEHHLAENLAQALGAEVNTQYRSFARGDTGGQEVSTSHQAVRVQTQLQRVVPDDEYWQRIERSGSEFYRVHLRLRVSRAELAQARWAQAGAQSKGQTPQVVLLFDGPRYAALERTVYFAGMGAHDYRIVDPQRVRSGAIRTAEDVQRILTPEHLVRGRVVRLEPLTFEMTLDSGAAATLEARAWHELTEQLPSAVHHLLVRGQGGPIQGSFAPQLGEGQP